MPWVFASVDNLRDRWRSLREIRVAAGLWLHVRSDREIKSQRAHQPNVAKVMTGADLIKKERQDQFLVHGITDKHDESLKKGELALAGVSYALAGAGVPQYASTFWPNGFGPIKIKDRIRNLIRAGAFIAAEIDRLQRMGITIGEEPISSERVVDPGHAQVPIDPAATLRQAVPRPPGWWGNAPITPRPDPAFDTTDTMTANEPAMFRHQDGQLVRVTDEEIRRRIVEERETLRERVLNTPFEGIPVTTPREMVEAQVRQQLEEERREAVVRNMNAGEADGTAIIVTDEALPINTGGTALPEPPPPRPPNDTPF